MAEEEGFILRLNLFHVNGIASSFRNVPTNIPSRERRLSRLVRLYRMDVPMGSLSGSGPPKALPAG